MSFRKKNIWLVGGGTGGHISPAIAICEELSNRGHQPIFITLEKNRDYPSIIEISKRIPVAFYLASAIPKSPAQLAQFFRNSLYSWQLLNKLGREKKPDAVIGFGGYPVFPALLWAFFHKISIYQHEQNSTHGLITKLFYPYSRKIFLSFPSQKKDTKSVVSGNPLRSIFLNLKETKSGKKINDIRKILIMGGSQGARDINGLYTAMIDDPFFKKIGITISTGKNEFEEIKKISRKTDHVFSFIENVPDYMVHSDLIISRSGSGSLYEILWSKKPAVFFPFPYASSNHQTSNALAIADDVFYKCIDIRPFDTMKAVELVKEFINILNSGKRKMPSTALPLNAHEIIVNTVIDDMS